MGRSVNTPCYYQTTREIVKGPYRKIIPPTPVETIPTAFYRESKVHQMMNSPGACPYNLLLPRPIPNSVYTEDRIRVVNNHPYRVIRQLYNEPNDPDNCW